MYLIGGESEVPDKVKECVRYTQNLENGKEDEVRGGEYIATFLKDYTKQEGM